MDDSTIKEDEVVNNVRLSRCFFFVSDILRQVIENGGVVSKKSRGKRFSLSAEQSSRFNYSNVSIPISEIAKRINALLEDDEMKKISHRDLTKWLISLGMLKEVARSDGKNTKLPTEQGVAMGISTEQRTGQSGTYTVTLYNKEAQAFVVDNLEAVVAMKYNK